MFRRNWSDFWRKPVSKPIANHEKAAGAQMVRRPPLTITGFGYGNGKENRLQLDTGIGITPQKIPASVR